MNFLPSKRDNDTSPKGSGELVPYNQRGYELAHAEGVARDILTAGVETGVIDPALVEFAATMVGEGRESALIIPLFDPLNRLDVFSRAEDPEQRSEKVYVAQKDYRTGYESAKVKEAHWVERTSSLSVKPGYFLSGNYSSSGIGPHSSLIIGTTPEAAEAILAWKQEQVTAFKKLGKEGPLGKAAGLIEPSFGGIDITDPQRAIQDLSTRLLMAAVIRKQLDGSGGMSASDFINDDVLDKRLKMLFGSIHGPYAKNYPAFTDKVAASAEMAVVDGMIDADRIKAVSAMLASDAAAFLQTAWKDIECMAALEQRGLGNVLRLTKVLQG